MDRGKSIDSSNIIILGPISEETHATAWVPARACRFSPHLCTNFFLLHRRKIPLALKTLRKHRTPCWKLFRSTDSEFRITPGWVAEFNVRPCQSGDNAFQNWCFHSCSFLFSFYVILIAHNVSINSWKLLCASTSTIVEYIDKHVWPVE